MSRACRQTGSERSVTTLTRSDVSILNRRLTASVLASASNQSIRPRRCGQEDREWKAYKWHGADQAMLLQW